MSRLRVLFGVAGTSAVIVMGWMGTATNTAPDVMAGSGKAPTRSTYEQPSVGPMTVGATATWTPPDRQEPTMKAVPAVHAGP
jgi:hypothetical protein